MRANLKNAVFNPAFIIAVIILYIAMLAGAWEEGSNDIYYLISITTAIGGASILLSVASALPFAYTFCDERRTGYINLSLIRSNTERYSLEKVFAAAVSGILVAFCAYVLFCASEFLININKGGLVIGNAFTQASDNNDMYDRLVHEGRQFVAFIIKSAAFILYGSIWPVISLAVATFTKNKYVVVAAPFLLEWLTAFVSCYIGINYVWWASYIDPGQLLLEGYATRFIYGGVPYVLLYLISAILLFGFIFRLRLVKGYTNG